LNVSKTERRNCDSFIDLISVCMNCQKSECKRSKDHLKQEKSAEKRHSESAVSC